MCSSTVLVLIVTIYEVVCEGMSVMPIGVGVTSSLIGRGVRVGTGVGTSVVGEIRTVLIVCNPKGCTGLFDVKARSGLLHMAVVLVTVGYTVDLWEPSVRVC